MDLAPMSPMNQQPRRMQPQRGVSLVEVMISMTLGLLVLAAMTTVFVNNSQSRREMNKAAEQLENGRYALQILKDELSMAGFYDTLVNLPSGATSAAPCSDTIADWDDTMAVSVEGINAGSFACITTARADTGMIFVQRASTTTEAGAPVANVPYLQVSLCGAEYADSTTRYKLATSTAGFDLKAIDCDVAVAPIRQYFRRIFYIDQNNVGGDGIPTLKRVDRGAGGALGAPVALVEGIEDLHFEYAVDTNGDGSPDAFKETPVADPDPAVNELDDIVGVKVWLIARSILPTAGYTDNKSYEFGTKAAYEPGDNFKRHVFNTYIELVHPVARREK